MYCIIRIIICIILPVLCTYRVHTLLVGCRIIILYRTIGKLQVAGRHWCVKTGNLELQSGVFPTSSEFTRHHFHHIEDWFALWRLICSVRSVVSALLCPVHSVQSALECTRFPLYSVLSALRFLCFSALCTVHGALCVVWVSTIYWLM